MSTLTGQYISQSYGGLIQLSTNTGIVTGSSTQLQDGLGTNLGVYLNGLGAITASTDILVNSITVGRGGGDSFSNTVLGERALINNTSAGTSNVAIGYYALVSSSHGDNNVAVGRGASQNNTSGSANVAIGLQAQSFGTTAGNNVSIGANSLLTNVTGSQNTAIGSEALRFNKSDYNVAIGHQAMYDNTTGTTNTVIGYNSGRGITTGNYNTILGASVTGLSSSLSNNIILADGQGNIRARYSGSWTLEGTVNTTASFALNAVSSSFAVSASWAPAQALNTGSLATTGSNTFVGNQTISGSVNNEVRALTITSQTASIDLSTGNFFTLTLVSGSTTHLNPTNLQPGETVNLQITQASSGIGNLSFASSISFPAVNAYTASAVLNAVDVISMVSFDGTKLRAVPSYLFI